MQQAVTRTAGLAMHGSSLVVGAEYFEHAARLVFKMVEDSNRVVSDRYEAPIVAEDR